jgi:hypothetical protein
MVANYILLAILVVLSISFVPMPFTYFVFE